MSAAIELAWAAGFFDGEGTTCVAARSNRSSYEQIGPYLQIQMSVDQVGWDCLIRFHAAIDGIGRFWTRPASGPRQEKNRWYVSGRREVNAVLALLWPYLSAPKRAQAAAALNEMSAYDMRKKAAANDSALTAAATKTLEEVQ